MIPDLEKARALRDVSLFQALDADELLALAGLAEEVELPGNTPVFAENDPGDALYVVLKGGVRVARGGRAIALLGAGECFGELALLDESPRSATVSTTVLSELLRIGRDDFLDILSLYPGVGRSVLEILARRLRAPATGP